MKKTLLWLLPLAAIVVIAPFSSSIDLAIASFFYDPSPSAHWPLNKNAIVQGIYHYGTLPAFATASAGLIFFAASFIWERWKRWRATALILPLSLALGSGLIANALLKDHWGRPRPRQVIEFGGTAQFSPFHLPLFGEEGSAFHSFCSGHATMGFFFLSLCLVGQRMRSKAIFYTGIACTVILGGGLSFARIAQGGHFFTDTLFSMLVMWYTALLIETLLFKPRAPKGPSSLTVLSKNNRMFAGRSPGLLLYASTLPNNRLP
ncbi:phosphatase PAP2 family protein [Simkania negevensis]|uniref:Phosphatase PAP2 family protein n=1 Tax=Simkania negevensis TaxID=83561 RepID=A0ABS3ASA3_9BACT|nr:phosphatase PAP2 family protein [Simkania negevensis]